MRGLLNTDLLLEGVSACSLERTRTQRRVQRTCSNAWYVKWAFFPASVITEPRKKMTQVSVLATFSICTISQLAEPGPSSRLMLIGSDFATDRTRRSARDSSLILRKANYPLIHSNWTIVWRSGAAKRLRFGTLCACRVACQTKVRVGRRMHRGE